MSKGLGDKSVEQGLCRTQRGGGVVKSGHGRREIQFWGKRWSEGAVKPPGSPKARRRCTGGGRRPARQGPARRCAQCRGRLRSAPHRRQGGMERKWPGLRRGHPPLAGATHTTGRKFARCREAAHLCNAKRTTPGIVVKGAFKTLFLKKTSALNMP